MKNTTIRISSSLLEEIKAVKELLGGGTYEDVLAGLVKTELMKTYAYINAGYVGVGAVVSHRGGGPLVIKTVEKGLVVFNDNSYVLNGGNTCHELVVLSDNYEDYECGIIPG